jgi:multicomponent Na+:H+ antiporter subunit E
MNNFTPQHNIASGLVFRTLLFSFIWWILSAGEITSWYIGIPAVAVSVYLSHKLIPGISLNWFAFFRFIPFFVLRSLQGGIDVAWRAFHPHLPITPNLIEYPLQVPAGVARIVMINTVSLLPGTLSADLHKNVLSIHVLDNKNDVARDLVAIEQYVAQIFYLRLTDINGDK